MIMVMVRVKTPLDEEEMLAIAHERAPQFRALPGLIQKYYVDYPEPGTYGGVYIFDSPESVAAYRASDLAKTIAAAYKATEPPVVEVIDVMFALRE
jgi:heme-degrading monooxygenase HmoA